MKEIPSNIIFDLSTFYKGFADETRLKILFHLLENKSSRVSDIANAIEMPPSAVSHQLQTLRHLNFVRPQKNGKEVYYALADDHIKIILEVGLDHLKEEGKNEL